MLSNTQWCWRRLFWESLDLGKIKPSNLKEIKPWTFIEGFGVLVFEAPILWPPGNEEPTHWERCWCWEKIEGGKEKGATEDEIVGCITNSQRIWANSGRWVKDRETWRATVHGVAVVKHDLVTTTIIQHILVTIIERQGAIFLVLPVQRNSIQKTIKSWVKRC